MRFAEPSFEILTEVDGPEVLRRLERAGRTCYKSEGRITGDSASAFVRMLVWRGHESVLEHEAVSVRITCDRGLSHEFVRHRIASFSQESTRYCNYGKTGGVAVVPMLVGLTDEQIDRRLDLYEHAERVYLAELTEGVKPQQARDNLPTCLQTELVMTCNLREWRHVFRLRTSQAAHPQMRSLMAGLLAEFKRRIPVVFDDL